MIVDQTSRPMAPRMRRAMVFMAGAVLLPLGLSVAQDFDAVEQQRLQTTRLQTRYFLGKPGQLGRYVVWSTATTATCYEGGVAGLGAFEPAATIKKDRRYGSVGKLKRIAEGAVRSSPVQQDR